MFNIRVLFTLLLTFAAQNALAYYDVLDTGEILPRGQFKATGDLQLQTDNGGADVQGTFDTGFSEDFGGRALIGTGRNDFYAGALGKWMPIPDAKGQPAVGFNVGLLYGHFDHTNELTVRWEPLISKKFQVENVILTPYASLPVGIRVHDTSAADHSNSTDIAWQLALGTQLQVEKWKQLQFIGEVGVAFSHAPAYITLGAVYYFDEASVK